MTATYNPPVEAMLRAMVGAGLDDVLSMPRYCTVDVGSVRDALSGFAQLAAEVIAPTDRPGDRRGARLDPATGEVQVPAELERAFAAFVEGGWGGLSAPEDVGGGAMPKVVALAVHEMFGAANLALSLNPMLTHSAIELLDQWADERQRATYLAPLVSGRCSGTMALTEPDAGSDLSGVRTVARPSGDGTWRVSGTKIFITWGEHRLSDNIFHLVLARTPDAPRGIKGISLFLVPRDRDDEAGQRTRNGVRCIGLEEKLGIHASPTCVMEFDDAEGELIGPLHGGMAAMFSMMNAARLGVGVQGVSVGEACLQQALHYAAERRQGRREGSDDVARLVDHPDVQRMLVDIAVTVDATRALTYATAMTADVAQHHEDVAARDAARRRLELLTPIAKAWPTDQGVRVASVALQVHGGAGFVEETGIAQRYRDIRIAPIYEGTNGIQAIDLVARKVARDHGRAAKELLSEIEASVSAAQHHPRLEITCNTLEEAVADARLATDWVVTTFDVRPDAVLAGASDYLELMALCVAGHLLLRRALSEPSAGATDGHARPSESLTRAELFALHQVSRRPRPAAIMSHLDVAAGALLAVC